MIRIEVRALNERPPAAPLAADFGEAGGTIGRAPGSTLALPDEKRFISRTQASIAFRAGAYVLRDLGSATPTIVNGTPVGNGREVPVCPGDEIRIADYILHVSAGAADAVPIPADPFADLLPPAPPAEPPRAAGASAAAVPPSILDDPFAATIATGPAGQVPQPNVIPADFDPFADLLPPTASAPPSAPAADPLKPSTAGSVDDIFGLKTPSQWDPLGPDDPLRGLQAPPPGGRPSVDPLAGFESQPIAKTPPVQRDDASLLSGAFRPPMPAAEPPAGHGRNVPSQTERPAAAPPRQAATPAPYEAAPPPTGMVVSWDTPNQTNGAGEIKTVILPSPKRAPTPPPTPVPERVAPAEPAPERTPRPPAPAPQPRAQAPSADHETLLRAFLEGAGAADLRVPGGLTPEFMALIGQVLRESVRGTLDLLLARALTKREVRAQATVIVARENNPLKFSPTVEAALNNLLAVEGETKGFMAPVAAMRDAYNDLRSHQFGFMAGMRAALGGVLARFDPAQLEKRLTQKSVVDSLIPGSRRAKLWELYEQLYRDISREAQDDFQTLFGREFLRAYEAQIEKLEEDDAADKR